MVTHKQSSRKSFKSWVVLIVLLFVSIFTLTACKLVNDEVQTNSSYDNSGRLRVLAPDPTFHPYTEAKDEDGEYVEIIDDNSGSFTWDLLFYLDQGTEKELGDIEHDQLYFGLMFYNTASRDKGDLYKYDANSNAVASGKKPIYSNNLSLIKQYYGFDVNDVVPSDDIQEGGIPHFYGLIPTENESKIARVYTAVDDVLDSFWVNDKSVISFPDFEVVIDGKYYTFRVVVNYDKLNLKSLPLPTEESVDDFYKNPFIDASGDDHNLFQFYYRDGRASQAEAGITGFTDCPASYMTYFTDETTGVFQIRFNPRLEQGTTNRYLKVKGLPKNSNRGESIFSSTLSFKAYTMTFSAYGVNSVETDYGGLYYDQDAYYFFNRNRLYDSKYGEYYSKLTGAFPEGRQITITRKALFTKDYNYALQSWTMNTMSENGKVIEETMPMGFDDSPYQNYLASLCVKGTTQTDGRTKYTTDCVSSLTLTQHSSFGIIDAYDKTTGFGYIRAEDMNTSDTAVLDYNNYVYEHIYQGEVEQTINDTPATCKANCGDLILVSSARLSGYKFYANFVKVRNFVMKGSFFAGDNFFTGENQFLSQVKVYVFNGAGDQIALYNPQGENGQSILYPYGSSETNKLPESEKHRTNPLIMKQDGAEFEISGLDYGDYLYFEKEQSVENGNTLPYNFHSPLMEDRQVFKGVEKRTLGAKFADDLYGDRNNVGIIGSQYNDDTNLVVNLYQISESGDSYEVKIGESGLKLLSKGLVNYEIIKTISEYEDENGYVTTNVIISLLLPSNVTLVGYNAETPSNTAVVVYSHNNEYYVAGQYYDPNALSYQTSFFSVEIKEINSTDGMNVSSTAVLYNNVVYAYNKKTKGTNGTNGWTYYASIESGGFNKSDMDANKNYKYDVLATNGTNWQQITYTYVDPSTVKVDNTTITIDGKVLEKNDNKMLLSGTRTESSTIATVYPTEMVHTTDKGSEPVYVYYDTKLYNTGYSTYERYYISPIAKQTTILDETKGAQTSDVLFFEQITNFNELLGKKIKLGSEIMSENSNFCKAVGAKIISTCYYYVEPLGEATKVAVRQYKKDNHDEAVDREMVVYSFADGTTYNGKVRTDKTNTYSASMMLFDFSGSNIAYNNSSAIGLKSGLYDVSGTQIDNNTTFKPSLGAPNISATHRTLSLDAAVTGTIIEPLYYNYSSNYNVRISYTLYSVETVDEINTVTTKDVYVYKVGPQWYYQIIKDTYLYTSAKDETDAQGTTTTTVTSAYYFVTDGNAHLFTFGTNCKISDVNGKPAFLVPSFYLISKDLCKDVVTNEIFIKDQTVGQTETETNIMGDTQVYATTTDGRVLYRMKATYEQQLKYYPEGDDDNNRPLTREMKTVRYSDASLYLVREAQLMTSSTESGSFVTILGKYILTDNAEEPIIYPGFSSLDVYTEDDAHILDSDPDGNFNYYSLDYTSQSIVVEGFPGITLLAGPPYPNPVLCFSVVHKANEEAVINLSFDVKEAYYVELMGTAIDPPDSDYIRDFTTYAFKDTLTNLMLNDYIDKTYWVLDRTTLKPIKPYKKVGDNYEAMPYEELSIQEIGLNDGDLTLYFNDTVGANGNYIYPVYMEYTLPNGEIGYKTINSEADVFIWSTSSTKLDGVGSYDIHTYSVGLDGTLYFNSGVQTDDNNVCVGLDGVSVGATTDPNNMINYDEVLLSGVTYAFRTDASQIDMNLYYGYWLDRGISVIDSYNSKDPYFLTGREAVVFMASPTVSITDDSGHDYIYRFKRWDIYTRYNSETLFYNRGLSESLVDRENAILRFQSYEAGYFVILPVYERVYSVEVGTAVIDGALNQGGGVNVLYDENSDEVDVDTREDRDLFTYNYYKTSYGDENTEGYYYSNIDGSVFLYFTGAFTQADAYGHSQPIFELRDDIFALRYSQTFGENYTGFLPLYYKVERDSNGDVTAVSAVKVLDELKKDEPGIVRLVHRGDQYEYILNEYQTNDDHTSLSSPLEVKNVATFGYETTLTLYGSDSRLYIKTNDTSAPAAINEVDGNTIHYTNVIESDDEEKDVQLQDLFNYAFSSYFSYDSIVGEDKGKTSVSLYFNPETRKFYRFNFELFGSDFRSALSAWNLSHNPSLTGNPGFWESFGRGWNDFWDIYFVGWGCRHELSTIKWEDLIGEEVAELQSTVFTDMQRVTNGRYGDHQYLSRTGSLSESELKYGYDEEGNRYVQATQQFKKTHIDRDAEVVLEAVANQGYRVEGWYKWEFDYDKGIWVDTKERVENSPVTYYDEIIKAEYNELDRCYYYITPYVETIELDDGSGNITKVRRYYRAYDEDQQKYVDPMVVPDKMLGAVRGYFINNSQTTTPNYVQVYRKGLLNDFYFDPEFTNKVDTLTYPVEEMTFIQAIRRSDAANVYTLSGQPVYMQVEEDPSIDRDNYDDDLYKLLTEHFYRGMEQGNITVDGNRLIIRKLHSNVRYVAKFIETYNEYIFAEDEDGSGIQVMAVYYNSSDPKKAREAGDNRELVIRTNAYNENMTKSTVDGLPVGYDSVQNTLDGNLFTFDEEGLTSRPVRDEFKGTFEENGENKNKYVGYDAYETLTNKGFADPSLIDDRKVYTETYRVNEVGDPSLGGKLNLKTMFFDADTNVFIVVRTKAENSLTVHSLGMVSSYNIVPILQPTDEYYNWNLQNKDNEEHASEVTDYLYYIFQVTYNRSINNEYSQYIVHPDRRASIVYDVLAGNYLYIHEQNKQNVGYAQYLDYYDVNDFRITFQEVEAQNVNGEQKIKFTYSADDRSDQYYLTHLVHANLISMDIYLQIRNMTFNNLYEALEYLSDLCNSPGQFKVKGVRLKNQTDSEIITDENEIFNIIRYNVQRDGKNKPAPWLIPSGRQNFINLTSIPIYTYTIQAITTDDFLNPTLTYEDNGKVKNVLNNNNKIYDADGNQQHILLDKLYTTAGTNDTTFMGAGQRDDTVNIHYPNDTSNTIFNHMFDGLEYADGDKSLLADMPFAANTMILFDGATTPCAGYQFVGWFEQKYNRDSQTWSELIMMSDSLTRPYISLAVSDTIVVALYKKVVNTSITYDTSMTDILVGSGLYGVDGKDFSTSMDGTNKTLSGVSYFDSNLFIKMLPYGGYRFSGINYKYTLSDGTEREGSVDLANPLITYFDVKNSSLDDNNMPYTNSTIRLNGIFTVMLPIKDVVLPDVSTKDITSLELTIVNKKLTLLYFEVENFYITTQIQANKIFTGFNFALVDKDNPNSYYVKTNGALVDGFDYGKRDCTNGYVLSYVDSSGTLIMTGYFDIDMSGQLVLVTYKERQIESGENNNSIAGWFINGCTAYATNEFPELSSDVVSAGNKYYEFPIVFKYDGALETFNSRDRFALDDNNQIYYASAHIISEYKEFVITHSFVEDVQYVNNAGYSARSSSYPVDVYSLMTYSGTYYYNTSEGAFSGVNGAIVIKNKNTYRFSDDSVITLSIDNKFVTVSGKLYVFVGWFAVDISAGSMVEGSSPTQLITTEKTLTTSSLYGAYEAKYVRADKVKFETNNNGQFEPVKDMTIGSTTLTVFDFYEDGGCYYALNGSNLTIDFTANEGYFLPDIEVLGFNGEQVDLEPVITNYPDYKEVVINKVNRDITIKAVFTKGYNVTVLKTLYPTLEMTSDNNYFLDNSISFTYTVGGVENVFYKVSDVIPGGTSVTFNYVGTSNYYFVGFYINGVLVSKDGDIYSDSYTHLVEDDVVIEARYVPYVYINVRSLLIGNNSQVTGFSAGIEFTNLKTGLVEKYNYDNYSGTSGYRRIPSGTIVKTTLNTGAGDSSYTFVSWNSIDDTFKSFREFSTSESFEVVATTDVAKTTYNGTACLTLAAVFAQTTRVNIEKTIEIRDEDRTEYMIGGEQTDVFKALFDVIIEYVDIYGRSRQVSMGSNSTLDNILIQRNSEFTIKIAISSIVSDRYFLSNLSYYAQNILTSLNDGALNKTVNFGSTATARINVDFAPTSNVTIYKELNGTISSIPELQVNYEVVNTLNEVVSSGSVGSTATFNVTSSNKIKLSETHPAGYTFVGWFVNGTLVEDLDNLPTDTNLSIVARYISSARLTLGKDISNASGISGVMFSAIASFDDGNGQFSVRELELSGNSVSGTFDASRDVVLVANHIAGYRFMGFKYATNGGTYKSLSAGNYESNTYQTVATMNFASATQVSVMAVYEKEYVVNYTITTVNDEISSTSGGSISGETNFYTQSTKSISFKLSVKSGYKVDGIYVNGSLLPSSPTYTDGKTVTITTNARNLNIEIRFVKQITFSVRVALEDTDDAGVMRNQFKIDPERFTLTTTSGGSNLTVYKQSTDGSDHSVYYNINSFSVGNYVSGLNIRYKTSSGQYSNNVTAGDGTTYKFDGWYVYDGRSVASSLYKVTSNQSTSLYLSGDLTLVAKFSKNGGSSASVQQRVEYEINNGQSVTSLNSFSYTVNNGIATLPDGQYFFLGYYTYLSSTGMRYLKVGNTYEKVPSGYATIIARFVKIIEVANDTSINGVTSFFANVVTSTNFGANSSLMRQGNSLRFAVGSTVNETATTTQGFAFSGTDFSNTNRFNDYSSKTQDDETQIAVYSIGIRTVVSVVDNVVSDVTTTRVNDESSVTINESQSSTQVTFRTTNSTNSSMFVGIYSPNGTPDEFSVGGTANEQVRTIGGRTIISLRYELEMKEEFGGFEINRDGTRQTITSLTYEYYVPAGARSITITAIFSKSFKASIVENDNDRGTAIVEKDNAVVNRYTLTVRSFEGYKINQVYLAPIVNGQIGDYVSLFSGSNPNTSGLSSLLTIDGGALNFDYSAPDDSGANYVVQLSPTFDLKQDVAIKVEYLRVITLNIEVVSSTTQTKSFYLYEDDSPMTLTKLKLFIDGLSTSLRELLSYIPEESCNFTYQGMTMDNSTSIDYADISQITIRLNRITQFGIKMFVDVDAEKSGSTLLYNAPTTALGVMYDGSNIGSYNAPKTFSYSLTTAKPVVATDGNNYYTFLGYYTGANPQSSTLISSSPSYVFTSQDIGDNPRLSKDASGNFIVYAIFKERLETITVTASYDSSLFTLHINNQDYDVTSSKDRFDFGVGKGAITYQQSGNTITITYPYSLVDTVDSTIQIVARDFSVVVDDPDAEPLLRLRGVGSFYEKHILAANQNDNVYYRFYQYTDRNGVLVGEKYNRTLEINLSDYEAGATLISSAIRLYMIEFGYDFAHANYTIELSLSQIDANKQIQTTTISSVSGEDFKTAILQYRAEAGLTISAKVIISANVYGNEFNFILGSKTMSLAELFTQISDTPSADDWNDLLNTSSFAGNFKLAQDLIYNISTTAQGAGATTRADQISFVASTNLSLLADFYGAKRDVRKYVAGTLLNPDYDLYGDFYITSESKNPNIIEKGDYYDSYSSKGVEDTNKKVTRQDTASLNEHLYRNESATNPSEFVFDLFTETDKVKFVYLEDMLQLLIDTLDNLGNMGARAYLNAIFTNEAGVSTKVENSWVDTNLSTWLSNYLSNTSGRGTINTSTLKYLRTSNANSNFAVRQFMSFDATAANNNEGTMQRIFNAAIMSYSSFNLSIKKVNKKSEPLYDDETGEITQQDSYIQLIDERDKTFFDGDHNPTAKATLRSLFGNNAVTVPLEQLLKNMEIKWKSSDKSDKISPCELMFLKQGDSVHFEIKIPDGFFFKGFMLVSGSYPSIMNLQAYGGETTIGLAPIYQFLTGSNSTYQTNYEVDLEGNQTATLDYTINGADTQIYVVLEPEVYKINLYSYEFKDSDVEGLPEGEITSFDSKVLSNEPFEGSTFKGDLLVERGGSAKISSISFPYIQFAGWSTLNDFGGSVYADEGIGISLSDVETRNLWVNGDRGLVTNNVYKRLSADDQGTIDFSHLQSNNTNNIYIKDIEANMDLVAYFTVVSYRIRFYLSEVLAAYTYADSSNGITKSTTDTYLAYSDFVINNPDWENPSAGTYKFYSKNKSNDRNEGESYTTIEIDAKDPYVYVFNDINGNPIKLDANLDGVSSDLYDSNCYPTRVQASLIDLDKSQAEGFLVYKGNTKKQSVRLIMAKPGASPGSTNLPYPYTDGEAFINTNARKYLEAEYEGKTTLNFDRLFAGNLSYTYGYNKSGQYELYKDSDKYYPKLDNIYNFLQAGSGVSGRPFKLLNGIFTIIIEGEGGQEIYESGGDKINLKFLNDEVSTQVAYFDIRVVATRNGLPTVKISLPDPDKDTRNDVTSIADGAVVPSGITAENFYPTSLNEAAQLNKLYLTGFHQERYDNMDLTKANDVDLGGLNMTIVLKWMQKAVSLETQVKLQNAGEGREDKGASLTGLTSVDKILQQLADTNAGEGIYGCSTRDEDSHVLDHDGQIQSYYLAVVENGQWILKLLDYLSGLKEVKSHDRGVARELYTKIQSATIADTDDHGRITAVSNTGNARSSQIGFSATENGTKKNNLFDYIDATPNDVAILITKYFDLLNIPALAAGMRTSAEVNADRNWWDNVKNFFNTWSPDFAKTLPDAIRNMFNVRVIDVYAYARSGINCNFVGNYIHANDLVIAQCVLTEHQRSQYDCSKFWFAAPYEKSGVCWSAEKGYDFYHHAVMTWGSNQSTTGLSSIPYDNDPANLKEEPEGNYQTETDPGFWKNVRNWFVGMFNGSEKYTGTYSRMIHTVMYIEDRTFATNNFESVNSITTIDCSHEADVLSAIHDWQSTPIWDGFVAYFLYNLIGPLAVIIDGIIMICTDGKHNLWERLSNLNF